MEEFWRLTPRETRAVVEAENWRLLRERQEWLWQAWHTAALLRTRRLPSLAALMRGAQERRPMTPRERALRHAEFEELRRRMGVQRDRGRARSGADSDSGDAGQTR